MLKSCRHFLSPLCRDTLGTRSSSPWFGVRSVGKGCCCELLTRTCSVRMPRIVSASFFLLSAGLKSPGRESESILLTRSSTILSIASRSCPPGATSFPKPPQSDPLFHPAGATAPTAAFHIGSQKSPPYSSQCLMIQAMTTSQKTNSHTFQKIPIIDNGPEKDYPVLREGACAPVPYSVSRSIKSTSDLTRFRIAVIRTMACRVLSLLPLFFFRVILFTSFVAF